MANIQHNEHKRQNAGASALASIPRGSCSAGPGGVGSLVHVSGGRLERFRRVGLLNDGGTLLNAGPLPLRKLKQEQRMARLPLLDKRLTVAPACLPAVTAEVTAMNLLSVLLCTDWFVYESTMRKLLELLNALSSRPTGLGPGT